MLRSVFSLMVMCAVFAVPNLAWAIKPLQDQFKAIYAGDEATEEFKSLVADAKCNVCHVEKEDKKKVRNPFGKSLHDLLEKDEFPIAEFKKDPAKYAERLKEIFKKVEGEASTDEKHKTFGDRIKANLLPGGDKYGK
ncbi:MAG: hypothetical protein KF752_15220 [Pirellulaceae bacterium]|nr:hypothetical protein [Pirellulaceae bacterium]